MERKRPPRDVLRAAAWINNDGVTLPIEHEKSNYKKIK